MGDGIKVETPCWRITLFGGLRLETGSQVITRFRSQNIGGLLAYLALKLGEPQSREYLAELFWPDAEPSAARTNLRTALASLRRQLEPPGVAGGSVLVSGGQTTVTLSSDAVIVDIRAFDRALRLASRRETPPAEVRERLGEALALYRGPFLPGFYEAWALGERDRTAELHRDALRQLSGLHEQAGDISAALDTGRLLVAADPLAEESHGMVIRLLMETDQERAARAQFQELTRLLEQELGAEPSPEIRALLRKSASKTAVRVSAPPVPAGIGAAFPLPFSGVTPVRPVVTSEPALPRTPVHLPLALTRFFGREEEVSQIADSLCGDEVRLLTLTGPGGTGKTRLAIEAARQMSAHFSGGTWFVPLAELPDASRFFEAVGKALGLSSGTGGNQEERVIAALQEKADSGPVLLVMDNFEQIVDSAAFPLNTLLNRVRTLSCLVTSRQRLLLEGEREQPVRPLPTPLHPGTPQVLLEFPSVQLFVNRAQAARSDFQLTARNADAITALCTRLEGIPLAIELSAAWSQTLTPAQMLERLNRRFDLLVSKRRDVSPRHSTLRATIEWSFRLLSLDLQSFFAQLSVFRGGWTLEAAETVSQDPFAMGFLAELCERSLIIAEETPNGTMRYRMLESMREFVAERLADSGASDIRRRYIGYFLDFSEAGAAQLTGPLQSEWLNRIEDDHGNLRAILAYFAASDAPDDKETHLRLAGTLWRFWMMRGYLTEGRQHLATALDRAESTPRPSRVLALAAAGNLAGAQGDRAEALRYLETCRDESRAIGDAVALSQSLSGLGNLAMHRGNFDEAKALYHEALELHHEQGNTRGAARTLLMLGNLAGNQADFTGARHCYEESLELSRRIEDQAGIALVFQNLGVITARQEHLEEAMDWYEKSLALRRELNDLPGLAATLETLGTTARKRGDTAAASRYYDESLALRRQMQDRPGTMLLRLNLALAAIDRSDPDDAANQVREALSLMRESGNDRYIPYVLETYASVCVLRGDEERAVRLWGASETLRAAIHAPGSASEIAERIAQRDDAARKMPPEKFAAALEAGRALTREEALALISG